MAALDTASVQIVVNGQDGCSRGVVHCEFAPRHNSYDDITSRMLVKEGQPPKTLLRIWDFKITRDDGSAILLHTQWQKTKVATFCAEGFERQVETPARGLGQSSGPGSCQANIRKNVQQ